MKYFTVDPSGARYLGSVTNARRFLKEHPEVIEIYRHWWSGCDLIEVEAYSRESLMQKKAKDLNAGATAQWAVAHRQL